LLGAVPGVQHRRPDRGRKFFFLRQRVVFLEKGYSLLRRQSLRVFRKRLRCNPYGLHLVSARFQRRPRPLQQRKRVRHLLPVLRPVQINKRRNRPYLRLLGGGHRDWRRLLLRAKNSAVASQRQQK
jgi:hypothetical protein